MPNPVGRPRKNPPLEPGKPLSPSRVDDTEDDVDDFEDVEQDDVPPPTSVPRVPPAPPSPPPGEVGAMSDEEAAEYSRAKTTDEQHVARVAAAIAAEGNPELQKRQQEKERRYRKAAVAGAPIAQALFNAETDPRRGKDLETTIPAIALRNYYPQTGGKVKEGHSVEVSLAEFKAAEKVGVLKRNDPLPGE